MLKELREQFQNNYVKATAGNESQRSDRIDLPKMIRSLRCDSFPAVVAIANLPQLF